MAAPVYTYSVHDLATNARLCDLPLRGVGYGFKLNDAGTIRGQFSVEDRSLVSRTVRDPYDVTMPCRRCVYVWRDEVPVAGGIIWTRRYDSKTRTVEIGCGDWWTYFDHRKILPVLSLPVAPAFTVAQLVQAPGSMDQNALARQLLTWAAAHTGGNLGIVSDSTLSLINADYTFRGYELRDVGEVLRELASASDGQDMLFGVGRAPDAQGRPVRTFRQGTPHLGQEGSAWVFEYGANMVSYTWPSDGSRYASRTFAGGEGTVEGTPIAVSEDTTGYTNGWPLMEAETGYTTVSDPTRLQSHADADQFSQRRPVALPKIEVRGDQAPRIGEWSMGDDARVVIVDDFHTTGFDGPMRIVAADITPPDDNTDEKVELTMAPLLDAVA